MEATILSDLWQVGGPGFTSPDDAAVYFVRFGEKAALVDAGCGNGNELLKSNVDKCLPVGVEIEYLFLTHCHFDHTGGAEAVRNEYGCKIVCSALDAVYLEGGDSEVTAASWYGSRMPPLAIDVKIEKDQQTFQVGDGRMTAHQWPGHSPGSLVYTTGNGGADHTVRPGCAWSHSPIPSFRPGRLSVFPRKTPGVGRRYPVRRALRRLPWKRNGSKVY